MFDTKTETKSQPVASEKPTALPGREKLVELAEKQFEVVVDGRKRFLSQTLSRSE